MRIDEELHLVLPLDDGFYAYHTPITEEVFRANFKILANTKAAIWGKGLAYAADVGPQISALTLVDEGEQVALERGEQGDYGASALLAELKRLTTVLKPTANGWEYLPVDKALDADVWQEVLSRLVFFTCLYVLSPKAARAGVSRAIAGVLNARITSLPTTAMDDFLRTWIEEPATPSGD